MIIPIGLEENELRRAPLISFGIMALCFVIHVGLPFTGMTTTDDLEESLLAFVTYYVENPHLELEDEVRSQFAEMGIAIEEIETIIKSQAAMQDIPGIMSEPNVHEIEAGSRELNDLAWRHLDMHFDRPGRKFGYIPTEGGVFKLLSHVFLHGGWWHLLGNLLFFYLSGPFLEDRWGRPFFLGFFCLGGMFAGMMHGVHYGDSTIPLVGASGAIAACLGAFLVNFATMKIKLFVWLGLIIVRTFDVAAWIVLPLYLLKELFFGFTIGSESGVAHWVHVWGFFFGVAVAGGMKWTGLQQKLDPKGLDLDDPENNPLRAVDIAERTGRGHEVLGILAKGVKNHPEYMEVWKLYWARAREAESKEDMRLAGRKLLPWYLKEGEVDQAYLIWQGFDRLMPNVRLPQGMVAKLAKGLFEAHRYDEAENMLMRCAETSAPHEAVGLFNLVKLAGGRNHRLALDMGAQLRDSSDLDEGRRREFESLWAKWEADPDYRDYQYQEIAVEVGEGDSGAAPSRGPVQAIEISSLPLAGGEEPVHHEVSQAAATPLDLSPETIRDEASFEAHQRQAFDAAFAAEGAPAVAAGPPPLPVAPVQGDPEVELPLPEVPVAQPAPASVPVSAGSGQTHADEEDPFDRLLDGPADDLVEPLHRIEALDVHPAIPERIGREGLVLVIREKHRKRIPFDRIHGMSLGIVQGEAQKSVVVLDLVCDPLTVARSKHRVFRVWANRFDARKLVPSENPKAAFFQLVGTLAKHSGAIVMPDRHVLSGKGLKRYPREEAFEWELYPVDHQAQRE